jgi:hypothetical protein
VTTEVAATSDYGIPHAWAVALRDKGFVGVRYHVRHNPVADLVGIAWFGRAERLRHPRTSRRQHLAADLLLEAAEHGVQVAADLPPAD